MTAQLSWNPRFEVRPDGIPKERYISPEFARLEAERLWTRSWQMACRLEEIPAPGDYSVYDIVDQSVLVVRQQDGSVAAFHNVCPHRGTALALGSGSFEQDRIVCPFHGWAWRCDGRNVFVLDAEEFCGGQPSQEQVGLRPVHVETWLGCAWINLARDPVPFEQQFAAARAYLDPLHVDRMRVHYWVKAVVPANWKIAQEAFLEAYHTPGTHPQLPVYGADGRMTHRSVRYDVYPGGHSSFRFSGAKSELRPDPQSELEHFIRHQSLLQEGLDAMTLERDVRLAESLRGKELPEGGALAAFVAALYESGAREGRELPAPEHATLAKWGGEFFVFPNFFILPQFGNALSYRSRPNGFDPDSCIYEIWSLTLPGAADPPRKPVCSLIQHDDAKALREIPLQDFSNVPRIQRGLHSVGFDASRLAANQEKAILHLHREIDRYLKPGGVAQSADE
jgi:phenylpropionate dioxygenase-like ring-hydroxylating dioxygenase large terminal subunit